MERGPAATLCAKDSFTTTCECSWGKKILEWTASPREAIDVIIELNNRFAVDGRDPVS